MIIRVSSRVSTHGGCWYWVEGCLTECPIPSNPSCHPHRHTLENTCVRSIPELHRLFWASHEELGIARANPMGEETAGSSQHCWALGEKQNDPEEHKILPATCLYSEFAYREMNHGPLQRDSGLSAVQGIAVRGSPPSPPSGRSPGPSQGAILGKQSWARAFSTSGKGKAQPGLSPAKTNRCGQGRDRVPALRGTNRGQRGDSGC